MIYIPKICGTCNGASNALNLAYSLINSQKKVYIYKEILHNPVIIEDLKSKGITCIDVLQDISKDSIVVIRAHGESKETFKYLDEHNIEYHDATCPNVIRIHNIIEDRYNHNYSIIIIGKKNHPEVIGSNGWCNNQGIIIEEEKEIDTINNLKENVLVICQTTTNEEKVKKIYKLIQEKYSSHNIEFINTICFAQKNIQKSSTEIAKKVKYMFIIGGKDSSNTKELYNVCNKYCKSYLFSDIKDFYKFIKQEKSINKRTNIAITGGASTPMKQIYEYKNLLEFYLTYKEEKEILEKNINKYNQTFIDNNNNIIKGAINKLININTGGKYIRGFLINLGYQIKGTKKNYSIPLAIAYETFQTAILIHDDIIDNATLRRNKETIPTTYYKEFIEGTNKECHIVAKETANSLGICLGDLGFYFANQIILKYYQNDCNLSKVFSYFNNVVINTIKGEIVDVTLPFEEQYIKHSTTLEKDIMEIYRLKTAWYTIIGPFTLGMILSNQSQNKIKALEEVLLPLGIAFQIKDDILGIYSNTNILGKTSSDISEYKQTLLYAYVIERCPNYHEELLKYYGKKDLVEEDIIKIQNIFEETGAKDYAINTMIKLFNEAKEKLTTVNISKKYKDILLGFINYLELRDK